MKVSQLAVSEIGPAPHCADAPTTLVLALSRREVHVGDHGPAIAHPEALGCVA
ncbi:MAG: hypothetical protein ACE367_14645 [Acidimicrobiales bacterium]